MKKLLATALVAITLSTPTLADQEVHEEIGLILTLAKNEEGFSWGYYMGFINGLRFACPDAFKKNVATNNQGDTTRFVLQKMREIHQEGHFLNLPKINAEPGVILNIVVGDAVCLGKHL